MSLTDFNNEHLGDYTLLFGLAGMAQREEQIESLHTQTQLLLSQLHVQHEHLRTEADRLAIEQRRLALEQQRADLERQAAALREEQFKRLKEIRNFLANSSAALDLLTDQSLA